MPASKVEETLAALRRSQERLEKLLAPMSAGELSAASYASEWTIAQVASHLGSGAEIFGLIVDAGARNAPPPGHDSFAGIWVRWDAKDPATQARDAVEAIGGFLAGVEALTADQRERWQIDVFGGHFDLPGLLAMRLAEHVVHGWDIAIATDAEATLLDDEVGFVIDNLARTVSRFGRPVQTPARVRVVTTDPARSFDLRLDGEAASLVAATAPESAGAVRLTGPAEAFIRLVYGRLDPDHTPDSVHPEGTDLDTLRRAFPGP